MSRVFVNNATLAAGQTFTLQAAVRNGDDGIGSRVRVGHGEIGHGQIRPVADEHKH